MAKQSKIEWTDATFNPWIGCTKVGTGCDHCYAEVSTPSRTRGIAWGPGAARQRTMPENWEKPEKWNATRFFECDECHWRGEAKDAVLAGHGMLCLCPGCPEQPPYLRPARRRVFCASLSDWLDNEVPIEWLVDLLDLIRRTPNLDWLLLSKRIGNWRSRLQQAAGWAYENGRHDVGIWIHNWLRGFGPENVWLGATVVNQAEADRDVPKLLQVPARVRFLSIEPMLGPIDLTNIKPSEPMHIRLPDTGLAPGTRLTVPCEKVHWVIAGGESGQKARPMDEEWCRDLLAQCRAAGVSFLMKQMGGVRDKRGALEDLPEDLRVREFPNANS